MNSDLGLLQLDVVVTDAAGKPVTGLQAKDFTLLDNGQPIKIVSFQPNGGALGRPESPVAVVLVLDMLELPRNLVLDELNSVQAFLRRNGGHLAQPISVFTLLETGLWQIGDASRDGNLLAQQVAHNTAFRLIRSFTRSQAVGGAESGASADRPWLKALKSLGEIATAERRAPGRKLLLWIGPGDGAGSGSVGNLTGPRENTFDTICWFSTLLREARMSLYNFSLGEINPSEFYLAYVPGVRVDAKVSAANLDRKVLAVQSGGRVLNRSFDLVAEMESCTDHANAFYTVTFDPPPAGRMDDYHTLKVQIDQPGLTVRSNTGYYDQPFYSDPPDPAIRQVTVALLEQILQAKPKNGDAEVAKQLQTIALTQRLDSQPGNAAVHGKKTEQALTIVTAESAFLPPPAAAIPADPPPDANAQRRLIALVANYLQQTMTKLPNFFAVRTTAHYQETAEFDAMHRRVVREPMHLAERYQETVVYRDGRELASVKHGKRNNRSVKYPYLVTYGTFGPVLGFVQDVIAAPGALTWSRWEQSPSGPRAVFRYHLAASSSRLLQGCCLPDGEGTTAFDRFVGYQGEITIDPAVGAIFRLQVDADIHQFPPMSRSDIVITYSSVEIGGETYICPQRSVSIAKSRSLTLMRQWDEGFRTYGPWATLVNDVSYGEYHMFRGESRILPGFSPDPQQ